MPLGTEVGLSPGDFVLDRDPQRGTAPNFWPMPIVAKWLDASRYHLGPGHIVRWGPSSS